MKILLLILSVVMAQDPFPVMPKNPIFRDIFTADPSGFGTFFFLLILYY
jgi:hypothetical protein